MHAKDAPVNGKNVFRILVINPGSTSTKLALFADDRETHRNSYSHSSTDLNRFRRISDQRAYRGAFVRRFLFRRRIDPGSLDAVSARGGLLKPLEGGVYRINQRMLDDLEGARYGEHASNLGAALAREVSSSAGCPAFVADPVTVDEMEELARLTGLPEIRRKSIFHALNQKSSAREVALRMGKRYEECNFIVAHMGGGISVGAHRRGRVVDVNNALDGDGPFSPERAGSLPSGQLADLCFGGEYDREGIRARLSPGGGLVAHRGSNSFRELRAAADSGDPQARLLFEALAYKVSQEICKHGATLGGDVDRIILTGGMAEDELLVRGIHQRVRHLARIETLPGEREMLSLARAALGVLRGETEAREYR